MKVQTSTYGDFEINDFIDLSKNELLFVLSMRNHVGVKKWMHDQNTIAKKQHFAFVDVLKASTNKKYFLVKKSDLIVGVIYFTEIDPKTSSLTFGLYTNLFDKVLKAGSMLVEVALSYLSQEIKPNLINLDVFEKNEGALFLYKKYDFSVVSSKKVNGQKVVEMSLELGNVL